jgi:D-glycero-alpha-D-manno-heptose-7-phosphate kinase
MRISYVGGGTDYPEYFKDSPGGVISAAINKYVYVYSNPLSDIAVENFRFTYRKSESVNNYSEFQHPVVRELLKYLNWSSRMNMGTFADLPSGIGLGGSSAFSVAMAKLLEIEDSDFSPSRYAEIAIHIERQVLKESGGHQDQYVSAFGGLRSYDFYGVEEPIVSSCLLNEGNSHYLEARQMLIWVGQTRNS